MRLQRHHYKYLAGITLALVGVSIFSWHNFQADQTNLEQHVTFGVSYSPRYAQELGLDPKRIYQDILQTNTYKKIRLSAYWDQIEPEQGKFDFKDLDYYVNQTGAYKKQVTLAVGYKLPRWPECYNPSWLDPKDTTLRQQETLKMLQAVVTHYQDNPAVTALQVENEPNFPFGECPPTDEQFLKKEVATVRSLTNKPIIMTDSGEYGLWAPVMQMSDVLGTTLYRSAYYRPFGFLYFQFRPWWYRIRSDLIRKLFAPNNQKTVIIELQTETWLNQPVKDTPIDQQITHLTLQEFKDNIQYARKTGFSDIYLWGIEWWYYLAAHNHPEYLNVSRNL